MYIYIYIYKFIYRVTSLSVVSKKHASHKHNHDSPANHKVSPCGANKEESRL